MEVGLAEAGGIELDQYFIGACVSFSCQWGAGEREVPDISGTERRTGLRYWDFLDLEVVIRPLIYDNASVALFGDVEDRLLWLGLVSCSVGRHSAGRHDLRCHAVGLGGRLALLLLIEQERSGGEQIMKQERPLLSLTY